MKRFAAIFLAIALIFTFTSCSNTQSEIKVGICFPDTDSDYVTEAELIIETLSSSGIKAELSTASAQEQPEAINTLVSNGCNVLIVCPADSTDLTSALSSAKAKGAKIIAYEKLIMNTDALDCGVMFDEYKAGASQAQYIVDMTGLDYTAASVNIELFCDSGNPSRYLNGVMSVLEPYINNGRIVIPSSQSDAASCSVASGTDAQVRMEKLISEQNYGSSVRLNAVLAQSDSLAAGVADALTTAGYTVMDIPLIVGQGCSDDAMNNILSGLQAMSIFHDNSIITATVSAIVLSYKTGIELKKEDESINNGKKDVPIYFCDISNVDITNYISQ